MAKIIARNARILIGGRDMSGWSNNTTLSLSSEMPDVTSFTDSNRTRLANSLKDTELTVDGFFGNSASEVDDNYRIMLAASVLAGMYPAGYTASLVGYEFPGVLTNYEQTYAVADAAAVSTTVAGSVYYWRSKSLYQGTLSGASAANQASVDFSGSSGSSYGIMRLLSLTGTTPEFSASMQESNDDIAWTTIYAVTSVSPASIGPITGASYSSQLSSASRYRRVAASLSGTSPCATFFVASAS